MLDKKKHIYTKRQQQVRRQLLVIGAGILLILIVVISINAKHAKAKQEAQEAAEAAQIQKAAEEEKETPTERLKRVKKEAKEKGYPEGVIKLLGKNPATVDFVENYDKKKDLPPEETLGDVLTEGEIPLILQWDERWGYAPYGTSCVAVSGCGPTCLTMVIAGLTGDETVTPAKVAAYGTEKGYVDEDNNTYWEFMRVGGRNWGVDCYESPMEETKIVAELQAGHPIILSVGPGDFTKSGHFIVLTDYVDGKIRVNDPFNQENSEKLWEFERLKDQTKAAWVYSYGE